MRKVEVTTLYYEDAYFGNMVNNCEKSYSDENILIQLFGEPRLPEEFDRFDIITKPIIEKGKFADKRNTTHYDTKATYTVNLDSVLEKVIAKKNMEELRSKAKEEIQNYSVLELATMLGIRGKLIKVANKELNFDDIVGEYIFKNELNVFEVKKNTHNIYTLNINTHPDLPPGYYIPDNLLLFKDSDTKEYKFSFLLKIAGVIDEKDYFKNTGKYPYKNPNGNREGYFHCWECGRWMPIKDRVDDGTCGC